MSVNLGGLSLKICKRIIGAHHHQALRKLSSTDEVGTPTVSSAKNGAKAIPPLLSEQAQSFMAERNRLAESLNDVSSKVKAHFAHVVKSEFNQCFNVTCSQNSSVFIHADSGYSYCAKCDRVKLLDNFHRLCPLGSITDDPDKHGITDADLYFSKLFPGQNITKLKKTDPSSAKLKRTLQFHKASKLFLDTLEEFDCYANHDNLSIYFTYKDANGFIVGHEELSCGSPEIDKTVMYTKCLSFQDRQHGSTLFLS